MIPAGVHLIDGLVGMLTGVAPIRYTILDRFKKEKKAISHLVFDASIRWWSVLRILVVVSLFLLSFRIGPVIG